MKDADAWKRLAELHLESNKRQAKYIEILTQERDAERARREAAEALLKVQWDMYASDPRVVPEGWAERYNEAMSRWIDANGWDDGDVPNDAKAMT